MPDSALPSVCVVGAGLAGSEAAWQVALRGRAVDLYEMRPERGTPVHKTGDFAELVCSNTFKSNLLDTATGLLKEEMRRCGSLILKVADATRIPAGSALAVDRERFARRVTEALEADPRIRVHREEMPAIPKEGIVILATGPLVSDSLFADIGRFTGRDYLYFFDAVSPIIEADSIDLSKVFRASRYGKGDDDYLNCPMDEEVYNRFIDAILGAAAGARGTTSRRRGSSRGASPSRRWRGGGGTRSASGPSSRWAWWIPEPAGGPTPSCSCGRTTPPPGTSTWWGSRTACAGGTRSGSSG